MTIRAFNDIHPRLANGVYVDEAAMVIGDVSVGEDTSIWPMSVVRGDVNSIQIGARTNIQDNSVLHVSHDSIFNPGGYALVIGDDVTVGHNVVLHGCTIGDRCLIGIGAVIMDGAAVEPGAMVGAGSLVTSGQVVEAGSLWFGSPAKRIRTLTAEEQKYLEYSARHYVRLKNRYME